MVVCLQTFEMNNFFCMFFFLLYVYCMFETVNDISPENGGIINKVKYIYDLLAEMIYSTQEPSHISTHNCHDHVKFYGLYYGRMVAYAACPIQSVTSQDAQMCLSAIGLVNTTSQSTGESCSLYQEMLQCVQRALHGHGLDCTIGDIKTSTMMFIPDMGFNFSVCQVTNVRGDICSSDQRLSQYTLLACGPYLQIMQAAGDPSTACVYAPSLLDCATQSLPLVGAKCGKDEITAALKSTEATAILNSRHGGLDLSQCFKTAPANTNTACTNHVTIFSNVAVQQCMGEMALVNITDLTDTDAVTAQCSIVQEVEGCMVRQLAKTGSTCTMSQMRTAISTYIKLTPPDNIINQIGHIGVCPANETYVTSSMCDSDVRLVSFYITGAKEVFESLAIIHSMKDYVCTTLSSGYAQTLLRPLDVTCTTQQTLSALASSYGNSVLSVLYPGLDVNHCLHVGGGIIG